jgi:hypothetical protein
MFLSFLPIIQVLQYVCLIFHVFQFSRHDPGRTVCISHVSCFLSFLPYSRSSSVCVLFSTFFSFLAIIQVLKCVFSFFMFFTLSRYILGPTVFVSHFQRFSVFSPYSRSNSVSVSFSTFLNVSSHISCPIV